MLIAFVLQKLRIVWFNTNPYSLLFQSTPVGSAKGIGKLSLIKFWPVLSRRKATKSQLWSGCMGLIWRIINFFVYSESLNTVLAGANGSVIYMLLKYRRKSQIRTYVMPDGSSYM